MHSDTLTRKKGTKKMESDNFAHNSGDKISEQI